MGGVVRGPSKPFPFQVGETVGELTVLAWERVELYKGKWSWQPFVRCSCGAEGFVDRTNLTKGATTRCRKCGQKAAEATRKKWWGYEAIEPRNEIRQAMLNRISACVNRCCNPNDKQWTRYGGRGITLYEPWRTDRREFLRYLTTLPGYGDLSLEIDRIDNSRGYEPGNLRFATRKQNMANRRTVNSMQAQLDALCAELDDLRHRIRGSEEQVHGTD